MGAPSRFSDAIAGQILERMVEGESLRSIAKDPEMPALRTIFGWLTANDEFRTAYQLASDARLDAWAEDIVALADGGEVTSEAVARDRLKIDSRKWLMSKLAPKKYGDKQFVETTADISVRQPLDFSKHTQEERDMLRALIMKGEAGAKLGGSSERTGTDYR